MAPKKDKKKKVYPEKTEEKQELKEDAATYEKKDRANVYDELTAEQSMQLNKAIEEADGGAEPLSLEEFKKMLSRIPKEDELPKEDKE